MNNIGMDADDDDLELLRQAALQSLQKKASTAFDLGPSKPRETVQQKLYSPPIRRGRGGYHQSNRGRNGMFHNQRSLNPNLISIPTEVESPAPKIDPPKAKSAFTNDKDSTFKLTLPQDRYCSSTVEKETKEQASSKFSRYDNSDDSESESEEEESEGSDSESTGVLKKAGSLEALMQELENEIQGKSNDPKIAKDPTKLSKIKRRNKRLRTGTVSSTTEKELLQANLDTEPINSPEPLQSEELISTHTTEKTHNIKELSPDLVQKSPSEDSKPYQNLPNRKTSPIPLMRNRSPPPQVLPRNASPLYMHRKRSPMHQRINPNNSNTFHNPPPFVPHHLHQQQIPLYVAATFAPPFPNIFNQPPPQFHPRPLSPLAINTEALCTIAKAPLSPRSAAFVLQNREIIAQRRRRSPKRSPSFSRSPSPRRSLSPLSRRLPRSLSKSPNRNRARSRSPLPPRRLTPPRSGRNNSPPRRRRSLSPGNARKNIRKPLRERRSPPPASKLSVRDRLGVRPREPVKVEKTSQNDKEVEEKVEEPAEDPILEARKRKFERTEINIKDGVIKLKKDDEQLNELPPTTDDDHSNVVPNNEELDEDLLLEDVLDTKVEDIFSDDQSDVDNEGRFKAIDKTVTKIGKSLNGTRDLKVEPLIKVERKRRDHHLDRLERDRKRRRKTPSTSPKQTEVDLESNSVKSAAVATPLKQRLIRLAKQKKALPPRVTSPIENKKIEIKIRNPAKYEASGSKYDVATEDETRRTDEKKERRVDLVTTEDVEELVLKDVAEEHDIVEDAELEAVAAHSNIDVDKCTDGGDLRAQLSRKRAERQNKPPAPQVIQTRLIKSALQDAVYKKVKKSKKSKHRDSALKDGKLPIHLRLGLGGSDVEIITERRKKSKKSKHRSLDQV